MNEIRKEKNLIKTFFNYSIPCIIAMFLTSFIIIVDGIFIGWKVGESGLAAINLTLPLMYILLAATLLIGVGGVTLAAQSLGAKQKSQANYYFSVALIGVLIVDTIIVLLITAFLKDIVLLLGAHGIVQEYVMDFLRVMVYFYVFMMLNMVFSMFIRAEGKPQLSLFFGISGNILNIILDYIFIMELGWDMRGAALASGLSALVPCLFGLLYFFANKSVYQLTKFRPNFVDFKNILLNGSAEFIAQISISITIFAFNRILMERIGINGVAAQMIIGYIVFMQSMVLTGIAIGIHPLISYHFGAKNMNIIFKLLGISLKAVCAVGLVVCIVSLVYAENIIHIFSLNNKELLSIGKLGLRIFSLAFLLNGYNIIAIAFFTSIGKPKAALLVSILRSLVLILFFLWVLPNILGDIGIWLTTPLAETITCAIAYILVMKFKNELL